MTARMALLDRLVLHAPHLSSKQMIPAFVCTDNREDGTAWKKEATTELVFQALTNGFTAIDTACQPKHYREDLVGEGLRKAVKGGFIRRDEIYLQTKFTSVDGQDLKNIPYDPHRPIIEQVKQSIERSLANLDVSEADGTSSSNAYLDTVVLHSPMRNIDETMQVWQTLETYVPQQIRNIGISNCDLFTLMDIYERSMIKPCVVQNRFYPSTKFDIGVRKFCNEKDIVYQSFWTLSANPELLRSKPVSELASTLNIGRQSALYCLVLGLGNIVVLNGTTSKSHMKDDFAALASAKAFADSNEDIWQRTMEQFKAIVGQK